MGILISTGVLVGIYVIAVLIFDGTSSNMFDFPLPMGAVIGGSLLFSVIAFGSGSGPTGGTSPGRARGQGRPTSPATDRLVVVLVPLAGKKRPSLEYAFRVRSLVEDRIRAIYGADYDLTIALWRGDPVPDRTAIEDDVSRVSNAGAFVEAMEASGLSGPATTAFFRSGLQVHELGNMGLLMVVGTVPIDGVTNSEPGEPAKPTVFAPLSTPRVEPPITSLSVGEGPLPDPVLLTCDICGDPIPRGTMLKAPASRIAQLTDEGYLPARLPDAMTEMAEDDAMLRQMWRVTVSVNETDWAMCGPCAQDIDRFAHGEPR